MLHSLRVRAVAAGLIAVSASGCLEAHIGPRTALPPALDTWTIDAWVGRWELRDSYSSSTLTISADGSFERIDRSCRGETRHRGTVRLGGGLLRLLGLRGPQVSPGSADEYPPWCLGPFHMVRWGARTYLVDESQIAEFCRDVSCGQVAMSHGRSRFWQRDEFRSEPVSGRPQVPAAWNDQIPAAPVAGQVVECLDARRSRVDLGAVDGLRVGMAVAMHMLPHRTAEWVTLDQSWYWVFPVTIESVEPRSCVVSWGSAPPLRTRVGLPVTALMPIDELPLEAWRASGTDPVLSHEALLPLHGGDAGELTGQSALLRARAEGDGTRLAVAASLAPLDIDEATPAVFNALVGLDMSRSSDVATADAILGPWADRFFHFGSTYTSFAFPGVEAGFGRAVVRRRIELIETFAMWWRELAADPDWFATLRPERR